MLRIATSENELLPILEPPFVNDESFESSSFDILVVYPDF
jgi:hypothetical protein